MPDAPPAFFTDYCKEVCYEITCCMIYYLNPHWSERRALNPLMTALFQNHNIFFEGSQTDPVDISGDD